MSQLIGSDFTLLQTMCRFGMPLGFGDKTVREVCEANKVDCHTFLAVVNFMNDNFFWVEDGEELSISTLLHYLRSSHDYFLDYSLPSIHSKLEEALEKSDDTATLILRFFDEYMKEVRQHMRYEEKTVFPYVDSLLKGSFSKSYEIATFSKHHKQVDEKLTELKNIIIKYYPGQQNNNLMSAALFDIYLNEKWLNAHCRIEDYLFVPTILRLERRLSAHEK